MESELLSPEQFAALFPDIAAEIRDRVEANKNREEWLKDRRGKFTASAIFRLFTKALKPANNDTSRNYIGDIVGERLGAWENETRAPTLDWGRTEEPKAVKYYEEATGTKIRKAFKQEFILYKKNPDFGATPDGWIGKKTVQIKCPKRIAIHEKYLRCKDWKEFKKKFPEYFIQIQCEILFSGATSSIFLSYHSRFDEPFKMKKLIIPKDKEFQPVLIETLTKANEEANSRIETIKNQKSTFIHKK